MSTEIRTASGMRPTGPLHLGHYFGVLKNWVDLQDKLRAFFFVTDWHALTTDFNRTEALRENTIEMVKDWIGSGLDPEKCTIFRQSDLKEHAELSLLLSMITPVSWVERNPTYKEQQQQITTKDLSCTGFLCYPILMAADILMYKPQGVPAGRRISVPPFRHRCAEIRSGRTGPAFRWPPVPPRAGRPASPRRLPWRRPGRASAPAAAPDPAVSCFVSPHPSSTPGGKGQKVVHFTSHMKKLKNLPPCSAV